MEVKGIIKKILIYGGLFICVSLAVGIAIEGMIVYLMAGMNGETVPFFSWSYFAEADTYKYGFGLTLAAILLYQVFSNQNSKKAKRMLKGKAKGVESVLENSRFMTDKERNEIFPGYGFAQSAEKKKDGVPVRAVYDKKKGLQVNLASPMHALIIGSTGSGKTTTFINPMIQILGASDAGSSMIMTDPKGELFQLHSGFLKERGYQVMVLDLRDTYESYRWNPLGDIYDRYQLYIEAGKGIYIRNDAPENSGLELQDDLEKFGEEWYEYQGQGYADRRELITVVKIKKQKIYDELYEDLNDLVGVLCPIESKDDPVWEKGARSIVMATLLAMLEDSENPELGMTKDKFNFYNLNKAMSNSENNFEELKNYFAGRPMTSRCVTLSRQVLSAADSTLSSYMSIAFDKLNMFNDEGLCALTSNTDIDPNCFADEKTALFLKIPDEKDTRHGLASMFILCIYKALIKKASAREDLSLPRNVYFILDEFGNMPQINKFDKMITVGRSRKIWFNMVVQSYAQLNNVYGDTVANIIKSNCGMKMFIGSNDIETCKEFSELCGNMTVTTASVSNGGQDKDISVSSQLQTRPLIYPSELQKLNNKQSTGNSIIVTFGNYPLKTQFTPSYQCPLYKIGAMDLTEARRNVFFGDEVYYDLGERNRSVLNTEEGREKEA
ncbi:type IV secretory system conjugative DNA transfer family protein [Hungatella hathewayi]|nr:type IV secretory system conjugative DNA transfer family protein [Hungatella hathewayi]MBS6756354.1 type IV secretory system conjugative DNA transfer family protein [Hungatella hathewayi]MBT9798712.1 TraM recognition domain-containing protein [Hungatella hathewayi]MCQ5383673.1 type IV secretory system conjugative DNA transfer family protein [Hungatella hathewayi]RGZ02505.1 type IV secretory system conjugative DNA transfer family protein [Hungatella hathewayi]RHB67443.1 type IV secretory sys